MDSLVDCLNFTDSAVQSSSVEALGMLCCNASARQQVVLGITTAAAVVTVANAFFAVLLHSQRSGLSAPAVILHP